MPQLTRLRLVSVGHPNARFDDLVLDFQDASGRPVDSTLWLRNGGGKSSLLNLFFAGVRPNRREFLGTSAETKRELSEYVQSADHSVVAYEWELDGPRGQLGFDDHAERFITGTFYEWKGSDLKRLYFACRATSKETRLTLEGLPVYREEAGKRAARRNWANFKQEWQSLQKDYPSRHVFLTEVQGEWRDVLEQAGIDPELFRYQVFMNHREGGADELFRFESHEEFVDFLLELVLDPTLGETVRGNLEKHRDDLRRGNHRLRPERELLQGLLDHLRPLVEIAGERKTLRGTADACRSRTRSLALHVQSRLAALESASRRFAEEYERERQLAEEHDSAAKGLRKRSAALRLFAADEKLLSAGRDLEAAKVRHEQAARMEKVWQAAVFLKNAMRFERIAAEHRAALHRRRTEQQPLLDVLCAAADRYAQTLHAQIETLRNRERSATERLHGLNTQAKNLRATAGRCGAEIARQSTIAAHLSGLLEEDRRRREALQKDGALLPNETGGAGLARWQSLLVEQRQSEATLAAELTEQRSLRESLVGRKHAAEVEAVAVAAREQAAWEQLSAATQKRNALESHPLLCATLEVERADAAQLTDATTHLVKQRAVTVMQRLVTLRVTIQEDQRAVHHLGDGGLLPPTRDVERLLAVFGGRIRAWSGWLYMAENVPTPRTAVQAAPQLALGVVIADVDFDAACALANNSGIEFEMPPVLAPERALSANQLVQCVVLGPQSDAWFDRSAGQQELLRREGRLETAAKQISDTEIEHKQTVELESELRDFRQAYPSGWFSSQQATIESLRITQAELEERSRSLQRQIDDTVRRVDDIDRETRSLRDAIRQSERRLQSVEQYVDQHESKAVSRGSELQTAEQAIVARQAEQSRCLDEADASEQEAGRVFNEIAVTRHELSQSELLFNQIEYRSAAPLVAVSGPVQQLRDDYLRQKAQYEEKVGEEGLLQLARENEENALPERRKFSECLDASVREEDVVHELQRLTDPDDAERVCDEARQTKFTALGAVGNLKQAVDQAQVRREEAVKRCREIGADMTISADDRPGTGDAAETAADDADHRAADQERIAQRSLENVAKAGAARDSADNAAEVMLSLTDQLQTIDGSHREMLERLTSGSDDEREGAPLELPDGELRNFLRQLQEALTDVKQQDSQLTSRRQKIVRDVRQAVSDPKFDQLQSQIVRQFRACDESQLEEHVERFLEQLALRLKTIEEKLEEIGQNRAQLISELQAVADDGYSVLRSAANQSRLPDSVPELAGSQFLNISLNWPDDPAEQRGRLAELIDELIDGEKMPSGLELIQRAVRRLAKPVRARVLNPDPNHKGQRLEITDLAKFSGGERLTCAVLLYCTLAQLRAKRRGLFHKPSGVLLLDNPIGSASRVTFINLQLDVARAMGVQLIYTTGVNDYEALRPLPNLIRLRNDRVNRNNGQHVVELGAEAPPIEAARVVRDDAHDGVAVASEQLHAP